MKIFLHQPQNQPIAYYRAILPDRFCARDLYKDDIQTHLATHLRVGDSRLDGVDQPYDAYVFQGVQKPADLDQLQGKLALSLQDDIWHVPPWNPASEAITEAHLAATDELIERSTALCLSTETLSQVVNVPEKTWVCPNLISAAAWSTGLNYWSAERPQRPDNDRIRILWAGSGSHDHDVNEIVPAVERLTSEYGDKILFLFFGYLPDELCQWVRIPGSNRAVSVPKEHYKGLIGYIEPVSFHDFFADMTEINADIALAPLVDEQFSSCRSNLKWLEYSMSGAATVATALPPYECVEQGEDGLLVLPEDSDGWYYAIKSLIEDAGLRRHMANSARKKVIEEYSWEHSPKKAQWLSFFRRLVD